MTNIFYNVTIYNIINLTDEREKLFTNQRLSSKIEIVFDSKCIWTAEMSEASAWSQKSRRSSVWKHDITDVHNHKNKKQKNTGKSQQAHSNVMRNLQHKSIWKNTEHDR